MAPLGSSRSALSSGVRSSSRSKKCTTTYEDHARSVGATTWAIGDLFKQDGKVGRDVTSNDSNASMCATGVNTAWSTTAAHDHAKSIGDATSAIADLFKHELKTEMVQSPMVPPQRLSAISPSRAAERAPARMSVSSSRVTMPATCAAAYQPAQHRSLTPCPQARAVQAQTVHGAATPQHVHASVAAPLYLTKVEQVYDEPDPAKLSRVSSLLRKVVGEVHEVQDRSHAVHEARITELTEMMKESWARREEEEARLETLDVRLRALQDDSVKKQEAVEEIQVRMGEWHEEHASSMCRMEQRTGANIEELRDLVKLSKDEVLRQFEEHSGTNAKLRSRIEDCNSHVETWKQVHDGEKEEFQRALRDLRSTTEQELSHLREVCGKIQSDNATLRRELEEVFREERQERQDLVLALEVQSSAHREREATVTSDLQNLNLSLRDLESNVSNALARETSSMSTRLDTFRGDVEAVRRELDAVGAHVRELGRARQSDSSGDLAELRSVVHDLAEVSRFQGEKLDELSKAELAREGRSLLATKVVSRSDRGTVTPSVASSGCLTPREGASRDGGFLASVPATQSRDAGARGSHTDFTRIFETSRLESGSSRANLSLCGPSSASRRSPSAGLFGEGALDVELRRPSTGLGARMIPAPTLTLKENSGRLGSQSVTSLSSPTSLDRTSLAMLTLTNGNS